MPFKSEKQRRYLFANEPEIARDWTETYGSRIQKSNGGIMMDAVIVDDDGNTYEESPLSNFRTEEEFNEYLKSIGVVQQVKDGGRIGLKKGMDRRTFMKIMGGLTTLPVLGKFFKGAEVAAPVTQKVMENFSSTASEAPQYFLDLANKIKLFGKESKIKPQERVNEYNYTGKNGDQYTLTEDISTGDMQITKDKIGVGSYGDKTYDTINDRTVLEFRAGRMDVKDEGLETQKAFKEADEYEEYKVEFDQDGTEAGADAIDEMIQKEIIEEAAEEAPSIKKAGGGIARMLGE